MHVQQLFVETLIDISQKLNNKPTEYHLLRVSGLLRQILWENLLEDASAATSLEAKFRVVKPKPYEPSAKLNESWAAMHAVHPETKRVNLGFGLRGGLLSGEPSEPGDQVDELSRKDFLAHPSHELSRLPMRAPIIDSRKKLICPRCFEPWLCELRDRIGGRPERLELCRADVTEIAVAAFGVVEVVGVVGHRAGSIDSGLSGRQS
jgi:hypothetical protein